MMITTYVLLFLSGCSLTALLFLICKYMNKPHYGHYLMLSQYIDREISRIKDSKAITVDEWTRQITKISDLEKLQRQLKDWGG